ncbi:MAG: condensation domain-containing protein, partial [Ardenticatenaceae bacterium]|nr:condensation domain-containing protein [Ardenticatenaceae bacterium]
MSDQAKLADRKAKLSEARRRLLEKRLKGKSGAAAAEDRIPHRDSSEPMPLSFSQQRFWFMHQFDPDNPTYNMHEAWEVKGTLELPALERALNHVVARHEALRTTIGLRDDVPVQFVHPDVKLNIPINDLSHLSEKAAALREIARQEARGLFDLEIGPLLRFSAVRLAKDHHALLLTIHHIISDEYANDVFWRDLGHFYAAESGQSLESTLPDLPIRYEDFTAWQIDRLRDGQEERQLAYWKNQLAGDPAALQLPTDRPRPPQQTFTGGFEQRELSSELVQPLQKLVQESGATPFMLLLAAYQAVLNRYSQANDIWVGTPIANRQRGEVKDLIGLFLNTVVMRARFEPAMTFRQLVEQVRQHALDAFAHQDLPFERLVDELRPQRDPAASPLFQVMFVYSPAANLTRSLPGLTFEWIPVDGGVSKFDLTLFASAGESHLTVAYEYNADLFERDTVTCLLGHLETFLTAALADPDQPLTQLPILAAEEREQ